MLSSSSQLAHPQGLGNVQQICPALNETFVLLCKRNQRRGCLSMCFSVLLHVDKSNSLIKRYNLDFLIDNFTMISPQQIVTPVGNYPCCMTINLAQKRIQMFPMKTDFNRLGIFSFPETNLICIQHKNSEFSVQQKNTQRKGYISYFHKDDMKKSKLDYEFVNFLKEEPFYTYLHPEPGNHHSLVCFSQFTSKEKNFLNILLHDVVESQGKLSSRVREITIPTHQKLTTNDYKLWEIRKGKLAVVHICTIFIYDLNSNNSRMLQLNLGKSGTLDAEVIFLRNFILFHHKDLLKKKRILSFIGVDSEHLELSLQDEEIQKRLIDIRTDPFDPEFYQEFKLDQGAMMLHIKRTSVFLLKQRYMMFLLHLNEDFDDDLLFDSLEVLDCL